MGDAGFESVTSTVPVAFDLIDIDVIPNFLMNPVWHSIDHNYQKENTKHFFNKLVT